MSEPLVIVGKGMAATRLVDELSTRALGRYAVIVIGAEPRPAYNRVLLSSVLAGEVDAADIELKPASWWRARGVTTIYGDPVASIDRAGKFVTLRNGLRVAYSRLVLATGSHPIRLPAPGMTLPGVLTFRDMGDADAMLAAARDGGRAVVIGGGLLGIEAAHGLARAGMRVTLVHLMDRLMERQLDARAAALLKRAIEAKGVTVLLNADTAWVTGETAATGLELKDGRVIPADLVVCAVGIRANVDLARACGLAINRGVVVDAGLATSDPDIFALGECAEAGGVVHGLVEPAYEQARVLASRLAGDETARYAGSTPATNLKVSGVGVFSAGDFIGAGKDTIVLSDEADGVYKKLVIDNERLVGAALVGDTRDALWYQELIRGNVDIGAMRDDLIFGRALAMAA